MPQNYYSKLELSTRAYYYSKLESKKLKIGVILRSGFRNRFLSAPVEESVLETGSHGFHNRASKKRFYILLRLPVNGANKNPNYREPVPKYSS